ncbi:MAG: hypothetical protein HOP11_02965 [Saprospiraceae bacterium]|nr:hypothetical protein [Saprospiraceae bacterium]
MLLYFNKIYSSILEFPFRWKCVVLLIFIFAFRLSFIGKGASSTGDEFRYWHAFHGFYDLAHGNIKEAINYFYTLGGRPILPFAYLPQFIIQGVLYIGFEIDPRSTLSLTYAQIFSVLYSILLLVIFFKILIKAFQVEKKSALFFTLILAALVDNNVYVRHLYPYDVTITLWFLLWLYFDRYRNYIISGICIVLITLIYPAYWPMSLLSILIVLYGERQHTIPFKTFQKAYLQLFLGGIISVTLIALMGYYSGHSMLDRTFEAGQAYLYDLYIPFDGSVSLLMNYYYKLDGILGVLLFTLGIFGLILVIRNFITHKNINPFFLVAILIIISLVFDEVYGRYTGQKMLYARMCKQYSPLLVIMLYYFYKQISFSFQKIFCIVMSFLIAFNLFSFHKEFYNLYYPRDILSKTRNSTSVGFEHDLLSSGTDTTLIRYNDYQTNVHYTIPPQSKNILSIPDSSIFVNFSYPSQVRLKWNDPFDSSGHSCIYSKPHFFSYKIYIFDCDRFNEIIKKSKFLKLYIFKMKK